MTNIITDESRAKFINLDHTLHYIQQIYKNAIDVDPAWMVELRRIGKYRLDDGAVQPAEQSTAAQLLQFDPYNWVPGLAQWVAQRVKDAAPIGIGSFMCPGLLNDRKATDKSVRCLVTVCADFDTGNPKKNLDELCKDLGLRPTIIATSGGITSEGHHKLHAHWRLDKPCYEPWKIAYIREQIAKKYNADQSFKRIPQVIRIPGSLYDKNEDFSTTEIVEFNDISIGF